MTIDVGYRSPADQPELVEMFRSLIRKAYQDTSNIRPPAASTSTVILANFDGGGLPLTAGQACFVEITFPCQLLSCHIFSGVASIDAGIQPFACSATIELRVATQGLWVSGSRPVYGAAAPSISGVEATVDITDWVTSFQPGDVLTYVLSSITGSATVLTISLPVKRLEVVNVGSQALTDSFGSVTPGQDFTTADGAPFVVRG